MFSNRESKVVRDHAFYSIIENASGNIDHST